MTTNINTSNQPTYGLEREFLEASQQLQQDKQTYGLQYIHLYIEDAEGDWLENWSWEDNLADYIDAFHLHCHQKKYNLAFDTLDACSEQLRQPRNHQQSLELYLKLVQLLEAEHPHLSDHDQELLGKSRECLTQIKYLLKQC